MRVASISDLHTDFAENRDAVVALAGEIHRKGADLVIIAGDISHKNDRIRRALLAFKQVASEVAYIPGNHDLWFDVPSARSLAHLNTWDRYRTELRTLCEGVGVHYLPNAPLVRGDVAIVGTCGWYDYSFLLPSIRQSIDEAVIKSKRFGGLMWADARLCVFRGDDGEPMEDGAVARQMESEFKAQLADVAMRSEVDGIIAVTHHLAFEEALHRTGELPWEFFNAFMGSDGLGRIIRAEPKVRGVIYGHTHIGKEHVIGGARVIGTPLGYPRERKGLSAEDVLSTRIAWFEL